MVVLMTLYEDYSNSSMPFLQKHSLKVSLPPHEVPQQSVIFNGTLKACKHPCMQIQQHWARGITIQPLLTILVRWVQTQSFCRETSLKPLHILQATLHIWIYGQVIQYISLDKRTVRQFSDFVMSIIKWIITLSSFLLCEGHWHPIIRIYIKHACLHTLHINSTVYDFHRADTNANWRQSSGAGLEAWQVWHLPGISHPVSFPDRERHEVKFLM